MCLLFFTLATNCTKDSSNNCISLGQRKDAGFTCISCTKRTGGAQGNPAAPPAGRSWGKGRERIQ